MANAKKWSLDSTEKGKACGSQTLGKSSKVWIAKILPLVKFGKPQAKKVALNTSCLANASTCKPKVSAQVTTLNYLTIPATGDAVGKKVSHGDSVTIGITHGSADQVNVKSV